MRRRRWGFVLAVSAAGVLAAGAEAQDAFAGPRLGWSEHRRLVLGGQIGHRVAGGLDLTVEGLRFFPTATGARPDVHVDRTAWQANVAALYAFDRRRRVVLYGGAAASWSRAGRTVVVDGVRSTLSETTWVPNLVVGARLPQARHHPFVEWRTELRGERQWILSVGARLALGGGGAG